MSVPRDDFNVIKCLPVSDASFVLLIDNEFSLKKKTFMILQTEHADIFSQKSQVGQCTVLN